MDNSVLVAVIRLQEYHIFKRGIGLISPPVQPNPVSKSDSTDDLIVKKKRESLIDDPVAYEIFKGLGVSAQFFISGKVLAWALSPEDEDFIDIHDYVERGQNHGFGIKVLTILRIVSNAAGFKDFNDDSQNRGKLRMMLWHGTKISAVAPILENGLQLPTNKGQMFGKGVYFADCISKSANYCDGGLIPANRISSRIGYLFLCDVLIGNFYHSYMANHTLTAPPVGHDSTKGFGLKIPNPEWNKEKNGCIWPLGPTVDEVDRAICTVATGNHYLQFNEYVVYSPSSVQPKYLVKVEFARNLIHENLY